MKISVISDGQGRIVAASFTALNAAPTAGHQVVDQATVPSGHRVHEVEAPPELAAEILSGNFARAISTCTLEIKGKNATLRSKASKK